MIIVSNFSAEYGISFWDDELNFINKFALGANFTGMCKQSNNVIWMADHQNNDLCRVILNPEVKIEKKLTLPNPGTHGIHIHNNNLYVCDTLYDRILVYNINSLQLVSQWKMSFENNDLHHVNSVFVDDNNCITSAFGLEKLQKGQRWKTKIGQGVIINLKKWFDGNGLPFVMYSNISIPHTAKIIDNQLMFLESATGNFVVGGESKFSSKSFLRGFDKSPDHYFVGASTVRPHGIINLNGDSILYKLNYDHKLIKSVEVPKELGEIFDIIWIRG